MQKEIRSSKLATFFACPVSDVDAMLFVFDVIKYLYSGIRLVKHQAHLLFYLNNPS